MRTIGTVLALGLCLAAAQPRRLDAAPFTPVDDAEVVEQLPASPLGPGAAQQRMLRHQLETEPRNLELATRTAWQQIELGRATSDPRFYGYAQGALAPWWDEAQPPVAVLVLRATIRQHDHDFSRALQDLDLALRADPANAQARLTQAVVLQVRGEYAAAKRSCLAALPLTRPLVAVTCITGVESLNGAAAKSYETLRRALERNGQENAEARAWALTSLAEMAARSGRPEAAEAHFRQALAEARSDDYLAGAYADFLLDQGRAAAVLELLHGRTRNDALLLRLALAERALAAADADSHVAALAERFAAARARGDAAHAREEARFALHLKDDPATALSLARQNWEVQREPWDARLLMEAALAAGQPAAARPALEFLAQSGLEDATLAKLADELRGRR